jgi:hypothetical protein
MTTRRKLLFALGSVLILVMAFSLLGHKSVHAERIVPASPEQIWAVITDAETYPDWNPVFVEVQGTYEDGATMTYQMKDASGATSKVNSTVIKFDPQRELEQFGGMRGVLTFDHHWILEPVEGGTKVIQHEDYRGIGVWFWDPSWFEGAYGRAIDGLAERLSR